MKSLRLKHFNLRLSILFEARRTGGVDYFSGKFYVFYVFFSLGLILQVMKHFGCSYGFHKHTECNPAVIEFMVLLETIYPGRK